jgi:fatty-acyl-CoA synthase
MSGGTQLSYSHGISAIALLGETLGANLRRVAADCADQEALVDVPSGRRWTYRQLDVDVDAVALGLVSAGIEAGDRVGIWAPNCAEWVLLQYATARIGAILVNINPAYRSHELGYVLRQSGVRLLVSAESFKTSDYRAMVGEVRSGVRELERVIYLGTADWDDLVAAGALAARGGQPACRSMTRSTSSTPAGRPASPRARPCPTTTS